MSGWRDYDGEGPDPDYGVFGDADSEPPPVEKPDPVREAEQRRWSAKRERERQVSRDFNSHMITLFNEGRKP